MDVYQAVSTVFQGLPTATDKLADAAMNQGASVAAVVYTLWRMEQRLSRLERMIDAVKSCQRTAGEKD